MTYTVADDLQSVTVTPGKLAGVVSVSVYAADEVLISDEYKLIIHSGKAGVPGINMLNGLDKAVDFEDGYSYGIKNKNNTVLSAVDTPVVEYSAAVDSTGAAAETLENSSAKAVVTDATCLNVSTDGVYLAFYTPLSGFEADRGYSVYAQVYTNSTKAYNASAWFLNFKASDSSAGMTVTYDSRTNTWKELKYTGTYAKNSTASPAINLKAEGKVAEGETTTITEVALDNMYVIPHYNVTYHMPDGTENTVSFNPVTSEYPLTLATEYTPRNDL